MQGQRMLFIHGLLRRGECLLPIGRQFQAEYLDLPGHRLSPRMDRYRVLDYLAHVNAAITDPVVLYGHSLGAMLSMLAAVERPDLVQAIILEDPPFHTMGRRIAETPLLHYFRSLLPFAGNSSVDARTLAQVEMLGPDMVTRIPFGKMRDASALRFTASCLREVDPEVLAPVLAGEWLEGWDWQDTAARIQCPVLLLQADGAAGGMLTNEDAAQFHSLAKDCTWITMSGIGHQAHWQDTSRITRHVTEFLLSL
jgi:pimeloyl-ACP methyl ester carboxylesterase